ncbi:MAG: glutaredoxin 3 [Pelagibacterales bacterium]|nr:glutaredoxin 3 [Pelagibacterales bacterium]
MPNITIYTTNVCPYCVRAKSLLQRKNVEFSEIKVTDNTIKEEMIKKSGGRMTVPQIFINDFHVGGCDDLYALESQGKLDELLK